jgi:hypothetical protein
LRLLASAATAAVVPLPLRALAASRPTLEVFFPQDPLATWFEPTFGAVKADGRRHLGIDLMAPKLSPVYSIADGTVQRIAQSPRAGRHLIVDHADGWQSWYLHLNNDSEGRDNGRADWALSVVEGIEEGSEVRTGQHIGFVGDSGNAEGAQPHTHFELHLRTRILNPYPYLVESQAVAAAVAHDHLVEHRARVPFPTHRVRPHSSRHQRGLLTAGFRVLATPRRAADVPWIARTSAPGTSDPPSSSFSRVSSISALPNPPVAREWRPGVVSDATRDVRIRVL